MYSSVVENVRVFGCVLYALRLPRATKFEAGGTELYLESLDHGVFKILIKDSDEDSTDSYQIITFRHISFEENRFLEASELEQVMEMKNEGDYDYESYDSQISD